MNYATDDLGRTFRRGDYVKITGFDTPVGSSRKAVADSIFGLIAYVYDPDWSEPRVTHTSKRGLCLRGGWDMTLVDAPDATPETGFVTRWKQGEDGGQVRLIRGATYSYIKDGEVVITNES